jgi:DNA-binding Xre family transcriptional regulator
LPFSSIFDITLSLKKNTFDISELVPVLSVMGVKAKLVSAVVKRRKTAGFTQQELSHRSDVSLASLRRFEHTGEIELSSLLKIAQALDCLDEFLALFPPAPPHDLRGAKYE